MFSVPFQPLKAINNALAEREPWQIVAITASTVIVVVWTNNLFNARESPLERARKTFFRLLRKAPYIPGKIDSELNKLRSNFKRDMAARTKGVEVRIKLPDQGLSAQTVNDEVKKHLELGKFDWRSGRVSGAVYHMDAAIAAVACDAYKLTAYTNPLHSDVFPGINKLEAEVVRIAVSLFHGDEQACGAVTTGGTESILLACKAFRDLANSKGISNPQIILPITAHSAFDKAAQYLQLSVKVIPVDVETMTVNVAAVRRAISRRTCLIVGSAPNFPYGTMDNIEELSALAVKYKIPLHVDACLGGWLSAFMPEAGFSIPKFDFELPGVSSISADTHKYGYAPKGSSILLFRLPEYRHHMYTVTTDWPGGVYGSPTVNGSRAGGIIASCWATMMFLGREKYVQMTKDIITTTRYIEKRLREVKGIYIFGTPATSVVAFGSDDLDIFRVGEALQNKGWSLNALQFPSGLHLAVTAVHTQPGIADAFVNDVIENVKIAMEDAGKPATGIMAVYGVSQTIADRSIVEDITKYYIDAMYHLTTDDD